MVLASRRFSSSLASFVSSASTSSPDGLFLTRPIFGDKMTIYLAFMMFTLSYDFSFNGLPWTK
jgi:hypothetical protein